MAEGNSTGIGIDLSAIENAINKADTALKNFVNASNSASTSIINNFKSIVEQGVNPLITQIDAANTAMSKLGDSKKSTKTTNDKNGAAPKQDSIVAQAKSSSANVVAELAKAENEQIKLNRSTERFLDLMSRINNDNANKTKNSAITKIDNEIESAKEKLEELQKKLNFYTKGEGKKAIGFVDLSSIQQEARALMNQLELLERQRDSLQANARLKKEIASIQERRSNAWGAMEQEKRAMEQEEERKKKEDKTRALSSKDAEETIYDNLIPQNILEQKKSVDALIDARNRLSREDADYEKTLKMLNAEIARHNKEIQEAQKGAKPTKDEAIRGALSSKSTLEEQKASLNRLRELQGQINRSTREGKKEYKQIAAAIRMAENNINRAERATKSFSKATQGARNVAKQLVGQFGAFLSVQGITNFIKQMVNARAEMEKQHKALEIIVQDKYKADEIWSETMQNALKSPFTIQQLTTYTKQLAAYRIETDKLVDTTRMLGDISAGVGVDMNRLILAYGQVRAATYLRASELRQFTEAGIPLLDELARHFTAVEGQMVSTGEIFQRISERAVSFSDVEEVIKKMTDEGGVFFRMQEEQSETLAGKQNKLKDAFTLMYNEIGESQSGLIHKYYDLGLLLVENWNRFVPIVQTLGIALSAAFATRGIINFVRWCGTLKTVLATANTAGLGFFETMKKLNKMPVGGWMTIISIIGTVIGAIISATSSANELQKELDKIDEESLKVLGEDKDIYQQLANEINDVTSSYAEQEEALDKLQRKYKDILPDEYLELEYIQKVKDGYVDAKQALEAYHESKAMAEKVQKIKENYKEDLDSEIEDYSIHGLRTTNKAGVSHFTHIMGKTEIQGKINEVIAMIDAGVISANQFDDKMDEVLQQYLGLQEKINYDFSDIQEVLVKQQKEIDKVKNTDTKFVGKTKEETKELRTLVKLNDTYTKSLSDNKTTIDNLKKSYKAYYDEIKKGEKVKKDSPEAKGVEENINKIKSDIKKAYKDLGKASPTDADMFNIAKLGGDNIDMEARKVGEDMAKGLMAGYEAELNKPEAALKLKENLLKAMVLDPADAQQYKTQIEPIITAIKEAYTSVGAELPVELETALRNGTVNIDAFMLDFVDQIDEMKGFMDFDDVSSNMQAGLDKALEAFATEPWQQKTLEIMNSIAEAHGVTLEEIGGLSLLTSSNVTEFANSLDNVYNSLNGRYLQWNFVVNTLGQNLTGMDATQSQSALQALEQQMKAVAALQKKFAPVNTNNKSKKGKGKTKSNKDKKDKKNDIVSQYKDAQDLLESMHDSFEELNEYFSKEEAKGKVLKAYGKQFEETFKKIGISIKSVDFTSIEGLTKALEILQQKASNKALKNFREDLGRAIAELKNDAEAEAAEKAFDKLTQDIDDLFTGYEMSKELFKEGFSTDVMKNLFNIEAFSLDDIEQKLKELSDAGEFDATEKLEQYLEYIEKIKELRNKEIEDEYNEFIKYSKKKLSDAAQFYLDEKLAKQRIEKAFAIKEGDTEEQKKAKTDAKNKAYAGVEKETRDKVREIEWEEFTQSDLFEEIMGDLSSASKHGIDFMIKQLEQYKESWADTPELVLQVIEKLRELRDVQNDIDISEKPMKSLKETREEIKESGKTKSEAEKGYMEASKKSFEASQEIPKLEAEIEALERQIGEMMQDDDTQKLFAQISKAEGDVTSVKQDEGLYGDNKHFAAYLKNLEEEVEELKNNENYAKVEKVRQQLSEAKQKKSKMESQKSEADAEVKTNKDILKLYKNENTLLQKRSEIIGKIGELTHDLYDASMELFDALGGSEDAKIFTDMSMGIMDSIIAAIQLQIQVSLLKPKFDTASSGAEGLGKAMNTAMGVIGWIVMGVQIVAKILSSILNYVDKKQQERIENEQKMLDELVEKYEELEEAIEKAYDEEALNEYYDNVLSNLDEQEKALERIIKLEESRGKKKDEDNIEEAKKELKELEKTRTEILEDTASDLGAIYDVRDATQDFVNAWLDAFQETGNGLKGLKENFKETFKDIMLQQAVMTGAGAIMKPLFDEINTALENDFVVDDTEYKNINKIADDQLGALDSFLTSFYEKYPDVFEAASELSGLQAGIEGITEQQAEVISAYLNSIRFFVHSIDENTKLLAEQGLTSSNMVNKLAQATNEFTSSSSQQDENPMLSQLQMLVEQTKAINDLLGSVTRHGHTKGGYGLKVFID